MSVIIRRTIPELTTLARNLITRADMRDVGLLEIERIRRRTIAGRDAEGQPFQAYSPGYQKRKGEELGAGTVNLTVSGAMLNALTIVDLTDDSVTIGFGS